VALYKQTFKEGLQLQEQFRILTGFPYIVAASATRLPIFGCKGTTFFVNQAYIPNIFSTFAV